MSINLLSQLAILWLFIMASIGTMDLLFSMVSAVQDWLTARRKINTELPALSASVEELRRRQSRLEVELDQLRRTASRNWSHERGAALPASTPSV